MSELQRAGDPAAALRVAPEAELPIESRRPMFERRGDVAEPQRAIGAVLEQMNAERSKLILRAQNPNLGVSQTQQAGTRQEVVEPALVQQIDLDMH